MRRNEHGAHPMTSETLDGLIAAAISEAQSIAREVGTVHSVASRRSQPDRDHLQMLARLDMWRSRMFGISERLLAALRISSSQQDGWEPIETAPKDEGEFFLAAWKCAGSSTGYDVGEVYRDGDSYFATMGRLSEPPTHWRPLPPAPRQTQEKEGSK
jgi:hypothetical protein